MLNNINHKSNFTPNLTSILGYEPAFPNIENLMKSGLDDQNHVTSYHLKPRNLRDALICEEIDTEMLINTQIKTICMT